MLTQMKGLYHLLNINVRTAVTLLLWDKDLHIVRYVDIGLNYEYLTSGNFLTDPRKCIETHSFR